MAWRSRGRREGISCPHVRRCTDRHIPNPDGLSNRRSCIHRLPAQRALVERQAVAAPVRTPVTQEAAGSSPVGPANFPLLVSTKYCSAARHPDFRVARHPSGTRQRSIICRGACPGWNSQLVTSSIPWGAESKAIVSRSESHDFLEYFSKRTVVLISNLPGNFLHG
jgi:hypothetical protein